MSGLVVASAFVVGFLGQVHCIGMCGGIAAVSCGGAARSGGMRRTAMVHAGRISAYAAQGALVGAAGGLLADHAPFAHAQLAVRVVAALVLVGAGLHIAGIAHVLGPLERLLAAPLARARAWLGAPSTGASGDLLRGVGWGLLPCGLVQGALALALATASGPAGALTMVAFGIGTTPVLVAVSQLTRRSFGGLMGASVRRAAGVLIIISGALHLSMAALDAGWMDLGAARPCCAGKAKREGATIGASTSSLHRWEDAGR